MKKLVTFFMFLFLFLLTACSEPGEDAPAHVKKAFKYYTAMNKHVDAISEGENYSVSSDKHFIDIEEEIIEYLDAALEDSSLTEEEEIIATNLKLMHLNIQVMSINDLNASLGGEAVDFSQELYKIKEPRYELEKVFKKYDLEYKK
jgi:hypothetical protein